MLRAMLKMTMPTLLLVCWGMFAAVRAAEVPADPAAEVQSLMGQAKKLGAKGRLPHAWWRLDKAVTAARKEGADAARWQVLHRQAEHLLNKARFLDKVRKGKSPLETLLGRFDQALLEIATLYDVQPDTLLSGTPLARDLLDRLNRANLDRQVMVDSLRVANRRLTETVGGRLAEQDSLITALRVQITALRHKLWETELRAGVAEADRSAAESVLTRKQQRDKAIADTRADFGPQEGELLLQADGAVVIRVHGISFGVGSASLQNGQDKLLDKIVAAIKRFPGAKVRVNGHTDATGSRQANLRLSRRRAETVARLLEKKLGLPRDSLETAGFGPDKPVAPNSTAKGRALNRRIDVVITPAS